VPAQPSSKETTKLSSKASGPITASRGRGARVGLREVAQQAGVAVSTVSRVLSGHPDVSGETRERVIGAVDELGYRPNALGRMLRKGATSTVGFSIGDISNPLMAEIALGAELRLSQSGHALLLSNSMSDLDQELGNLETLEQRRVDGLLLSVTDETDVRLTEVLNRFEGPMVAIDRDITTTGRISAVYSDHAAGIEAALEALAAAGHRHIALFTGPSDLRPARQRADAATATAARLDMTCSVWRARDLADADTSLAAVIKQARADGVTAIIAGHNQLLAQVLEALEELRLTYPRDLSLVTCDEVPLLRFFRPSIATIARDHRELGRQAVELLLELLASPTAPPRSVVLPTHLLPGESIAHG